LTQPQSNRDPAEDAIIIHPLIAEAGKKGNGCNDGSGGQGAPAHGERSNNGYTTGFPGDEKKNCKVKHF
jgi:hypothetical protein